MPIGFGVGPSRVAPMLTITPNRGFALARIERPSSHLYMLMTNPLTQLGRQAITSLGGRIQYMPNVYVVAISPTPDEIERYYLRKLGVTVLPELREYSSGRMVNSWRGLQSLFAL